MNPSSSFSQIYFKIETVILPFLATLSIALLILASHISTTYAHIVHIDKIVWTVATILFFSVVTRYKSRIVSEYKKFRKKDEDIHLELGETVNHMATVTQDNYDGIATLSGDVAGIKKTVDSMIEVKDKKRRYKRESEEMLMKYINIFEEPVRTWVSKTFHDLHEFYSATHQQGLLEISDKTMIENFRVVYNEALRDAESTLSCKFCKRFLEIQEENKVKYETGICEIVTDRYNSKHERLHEENLRFEEETLQSMLKAYTQTK